MLVPIPVGIAARRAMEIFIGITAADKYKTLSADLGDDPLVSTTARQCLRLPSPLRARI